MVRPYKDKTNPQPAAFSLGSQPTLYNKQSRKPNNNPYSHQPKMVGLD